LIMSNLLLELGPFVLKGTSSFFLTEWRMIWNPSLWLGLMLCKSLWAMPWTLPFCTSLFSPLL
jgi:hypothetical protein